MSCPNTCWPTLYACDLDDDVTERDVIRFFKGFEGARPLAGVDICDDPKVGRYAQVKFFNRGDANLASENRQSSLLNGRHCKIVHSHPNPSAIKYFAHTLRVENLDDSVTGRMLLAIFCDYGDVETAWVERDSSGKTKGFGFVRFARYDDCEWAIEEHNGKLLCGNRLCLQPVVSKEHREISVDTSKYKKNVPESTTKEDRKKSCMFGLVTSVAVMNKSKTRTILNLDKSEVAAKFIKLFSGKVFNDMQWSFRKAQKKHDREQELQIYDGLSAEDGNKTMRFVFYVRNMDNRIDDDKLRELSATFSRISSCEVMRDHDGFREGYGSAMFSAVEEYPPTAVEEYPPTLYGMNERIAVGKCLFVALACEKKVAKASPQILKVNAIGAGSSSAAKASRDTKHVSQEVQAGHYADQLASLSLKCSLVS